MCIETISMMLKDLSQIMQDCDCQRSQFIIWMCTKVLANDDPGQKENDKLYSAFVEPSDHTCK